MIPRTWKSGANGCWWAIVPRVKDSTHPLPWLIGSTRNRAWGAWRNHHEGCDLSAVDWTAVRVFVVEAA